MGKEEEMKVEAHTHIQVSNNPSYSRSQQIHALIDRSITTTCGQTFAIVSFITHGIIGPLYTRHNSHI